MNMKPAIDPISAELIGTDRFGDLNCQFLGHNPLVRIDHQNPLVLEFGMAQGPVSVLGPLAIPQELITFAPCCFAIARVAVGGTGIDHDHFISPAQMDRDRRTGSSLSLSVGNQHADRNPRRRHGGRG